MYELGRVHVSAYEASTRRRVLAKTLPFKMWDEVVPELRDGDERIVQPADRWKPPRAGSVSALRG